jgi:RND family efflux transporter MFP subunit
MRKLFIFFALITFSSVLVKYSSTSTSTSTSSSTPTSNQPLEEKPIQEQNIISLDKESQLLFKLRTIPATNKVIQNSIAIPATIKMRPQSKATIGSTVGGLLKMTRTLGIGDRVKKDEIIATVQQPLSVPDQIALDAYQLEQRTRRIRIEDEVDHTRKLLVIANVELSRIRKLYEVGATSLKKLQEAEQKVEFASIEVAHAIRNSIDLGAKDKIFNNSTTVKAPFDGIVASIESTGGQQIDSGANILTIVDLSNVLIEAQIFEADLPKLYNATSITYKVPSVDNKTYTIPIKQNKPPFTLSTALNTATRTIAAYFEIPNLNNRLIDNLLVELELNSSNNEEKLTVPLQAIAEEGSQKIVFVYKGGEQFEKRIVTLGSQNKTDVEILSGLNLGERVVTEGLYQLKSKK